MEEATRKRLGGPWSVAVLSGRPGVGATLITAASGALVDAAVGPVGQNVILMDADLRTGGLTALLRGWTAGGGCVDGLAGFALDTGSFHERSVQGRLQELRSPDGRVGDMCLLGLSTPGNPDLARLPDLPQIMGRSVELLRELAGCLLVDCGAGWGPQTLEVCNAVEFIALIGGPKDRAGDETLRLLDHLKEHGLLRKTIGYVRNLPDRGPHPAADAEPGNGTFPLRTFVDLPYDPHVAAAVRDGQLPDAEAPFGAVLRQGMEALEPVLFRSGFDIY